MAGMLSSVAPAVCGVSTVCGTPAQRAGEWLGTAAGSLAQEILAKQLAVADYDPANPNNPNTVQHLMAGDTVTLFQKTFEGGQPIVRFAQPGGVVGVA